MKEKNFLDRVLMPAGAALGRNKYLLAIRDGFMLAFPLTMFASIIVVLMNFPGLSNIMSEETLTAYKAFLGQAPNATMNLMAIWVAFGIGYYLSISHNIKAPIYGAVISTGCFFMLMPVVSTGNPYPEDSAILMRWLGGSALLVAIIASISSTSIYCYFIKKNWVIKMPEQVPESVSKSFAAIIPGSITLLVFLVVYNIFRLAGTDVFTFIYTVLQVPLQSLGSGLVPTLIAVFFTQVLWFVGLHGQIIVSSVMDPLVWQPALLENFQAYQTGQPLPNIVTKQFMSTYSVAMGGNGCTLAIVLLMLRSKSQQLKTMGKLSLGASAFNVSEPVTFGMPVVLNPLVAIPWIVAPMVGIAIAYLSMYFGLVPYTTGVSVPWTTPIFINGVLATNSIRGGILQLVILFVVVLIWWPFIKKLDNIYVANESGENDIQEES